MTHIHATPPTAPNRLLTVAEVASLLGKSRAWVYRSAEGGVLPCVHVGRSVRFHPDDLARWINERRIPAEGCEVVDV